MNALCGLVYVVSYSIPSVPSPVLALANLHLDPGTERVERSHRTYEELTIFVYFKS